MASRTPKKLAIIYILEALEKHSSETVKISQQKLIELVYEDHGMKLDRKTIRHNLSMLLEAKFPLEYEERRRINKHGQEEVILTNWYYKHERKWDDSELRMMIDSLIFSNYLPPKQCRDMVKKIAELGNEESQRKLSGTYDTAIQRPVNKSLFYTISVLTDAISLKKQVMFRYCDYDTDMKLHPRQADGEDKIYTVNPYKLLSLNGRYYLLCNTKHHEGISAFRVDRINDIGILKTAVKSVRSIKGYENGIDLGEYITEHPNMWGGEVIRCTLRCSRYTVNDLIDSFGDSFRVSRDMGDTIDISVRVSEDAMFHWALQFADCVEVISPESLRKKIGKTLREAADKYR